LLLVAPGPLYRTEGSSVSLWCNVSGVSVVSFEWSMFPAHQPRRKLQIVSSADPEFSYAIYQERVRGRRDIYLERVRGDIARLHITHLRAQDAGEYECYTPTHTYPGGYSASVTLKVIPAVLQVSVPSPQELTLHADDTLRMVCEVSSSNARHTHFSVTWYREDSTKPLLHLSKLSIVSAGPSFQDRHLAGHLRLEKVSPIWYQLTMSNLQPTDQAEYYCQATEWIQDPDWTWYPLTTLRSRATRVLVRSPGTLLMDGAPGNEGGGRGQLSMVDRPGKG
ncbi:PREDICTED: immunoglobulin superfamily member 3-like, partial [Nanorana parkeri]|uniref:immunoglobulin superfamily member 3-like n=1 Tax=Nanorana parkeri TaxID=125878 RepID=UPI000854A52F